MPAGSKTERPPHLGECRTTDDVRLLFERYRAEARLHAGLPPQPTSAVERVRQARRVKRPIGAAR